MEAFDNTTDESVVLKGILSEWQFIQLSFFGAGLISVISFVGVVTNILNIITFIKMNPNDGLTVNFLALSLSDFVVSLFNFVYSFALLTYSQERLHGVMYSIDPLILRICLGNPAMMMYTVTILITAFISIARCLCVVMPIRFKHAMSVKRSVIFVVFSFLFACATYFPVMVNMVVWKGFSPEINATRFLLKILPDREKIKDVTFTLTQSQLTMATTGILIGCVFILSWKLKKAAEFRRSASAVTGTCNEVSEKSDDDTKLSPKELQVVKQVLLLSVIYIIFNSPMMVFSLTSSIVPGFDVSLSRDRFARLYLGLSLVRRAFAQANSSSNFFVYVKYNSKFYKTLRPKKA